MREEGSKNHKFTTPDGYTFNEVEGSLFHFPRKREEAFKEFKEILLPIIKQHLSTIHDDRVKNLKKQYFIEFFKKYIPN